MFGGHMPRTHNLPESWHDTPNNQFCTNKDILALCDDLGARVDRAESNKAYATKLVSMPLFAQNLFGEQAVFLLSR
jgi:hypothetical protein